MPALSLLAAATAAALSCSVIDGDTLRCEGERVRLLGIDAPEIGHCRKGRECAPGEMPRSFIRACKRSLQNIEGTL